MDYDLHQQAVAQKMVAASEYTSGAMLGNINRESAMQRLITRVETVAKGLYEIGHRLKEHADTVYGSVPENDRAEATSPCRAGQIGLLEDALDRLAEAESFVAVQASRNCTLA